MKKTINFFKFLKNNKASILPVAIVAMFIMISIGYASINIFVKQKVSMDSFKKFRLESSLKSELINACSEIYDVIQYLGDPKNCLPTGSSNKDARVKYNTRFVISKHFSTIDNIVFPKEYTHGDFHTFSGKQIDLTYLINAQATEFDNPTCFGIYANIKPKIVMGDGDGVNISIRHYQYEKDKDNNAAAYLDDCGYSLYNDKYVYDSTETKEVRFSSLTADKKKQKLYDNTKIYISGEERMSSKTNKISPLSVHISSYVNDYQLYSYEHRTAAGTVDYRKNELLRKILRDPRGYFINCGTATLTINGVLSNLYGGNGTDLPTSPNKANMEEYINKNFYKRRTNENYYGGCTTDDNIDIGDASGRSKSISVDFKETVEEIYNRSGAYSDVANAIRNNGIWIAFLDYKKEYKDHAVDITGGSGDTVNDILKGVNYYVKHSSQGYVLSTKGHYNEKDYKVCTVRLYFDLFMTKLYAENAVYARRICRVRRNSEGVFIIEEQWNFDNADRKWKHVKPEATDDDVYNKEKLLGDEIALPLSYNEQKYSDIFIPECMCVETTATNPTHLSPGVRINIVKYINNIKFHIQKWEVEYN